MRLRKLLVVIALSGICTGVLAEEGSTETFCSAITSATKAKAVDTSLIGNATATVKIGEEEYINVTWAIEQGNQVQNCSGHDDYATLCNLLKSQGATVAVTTSFEGEIGGKDIKIDAVTKTSAYGKGTVCNVASDLNNWLRDNVTNASR